MGLRFFKEIDKNKWQYLKHEIDIQNILENGLKGTNDKLALNTTLKDLMQIYDTKANAFKVIFDLPVEMRNRKFTDFLVINNKKIYLTRL